MGCLMTVVYSAKGSVLHSHYTSSLQLMRPQSADLVFIYSSALTSASMTYASCRWWALTKKKKKMAWKHIGFWFCTCFFWERRESALVRRDYGIKFYAWVTSPSGFFKKIFVRARSLMLRVIIKKSVNNKLFEGRGFKWHRWVGVTVWGKLL